MFDSLNTEKAYSLDIRDFKETGEKLKEAINNAVKDTQRVIVRAMPDKLIMTPKQYDDLSTRPEFIKQQDSILDVGQEFWLYRTPYNIMEVVVE